MKKIFRFILILIMSLSVTACSGNFSQVNLDEPIAIPENGIIEKSVFDKIKDENAVATFTGVSSEMEYEWTVFGSDLEETKDVNMAINLEETEEGLKLSFGATEDLGFAALLSIHLNEKWEAQSANAYQEEEVVYSVSITGSKTSILNISVNKIVDECLIIPDEVVKEEENISDNKNADREVSKGNTGVDEYLTDPIPAGKPTPVEPEYQEIDKQKKYTCTFSIECSTILNNLDKLDPDKIELVPSNGVILPPTKVTFYEGESVFDVLQRVCKQNNIHLESSWTPMYNSAYIEGIHNLYEFDCGELSGWVYRVNGWYPNYGCSRYQLVDGEKVEWRYTCDLGKDVGCNWMK